MRQPHRFTFAALIVAISLAIAFALVSCAGEPATTKLEANGASYKGFSGRAPSSPTTEAPPITTTDTQEDKTTPQLDEPAPQSHTTRSSASGDPSGSDAWKCIAVLESGNGTASHNIYGILDSRVNSMSADEQLAYAQRIQRQSGWAGGWPETSRECGLS